MRAGTAAAAITALCLMGAMLAGCSDDSTASAPTLETSGTLAIYAESGTVGLAGVDAEFSDVRVFNRTTGQWIDLLKGTHRTVDLASGRAFVANFTVPPGDYSGLEATLLPVSFTMAGTKFTCVATNGYPRRIGPIVEPAAVVHVPENGVAKLRVELPGIEGTCATPGDLNAKLTYGSPRITP